MPRRVIFLVVTVAVLAAGAVGAFAWQQRVGSPLVEPVRVGAGSAGESRLVAHVLVGLLEHADIPAEFVGFSSASDARQGLELGAIDVLPSYSGAVWMDEYGWANPPGDPRTSYERVRRADADQDLVWLPPTQVNATFAFVVPGPPRRGAGLQRIADLSILNTETEGKLCVDAEFAEREDGLSSLVPRVIALDQSVLTSRIVEATPEQAVTGVVHGDCLAGLTTATDGRAWSQGLRVLTDERQALPAFVLATVVRVSLVEDRPEAIAALRLFDERVETQRLARWNALAISRDLETVATAAVESLLAEDEPSEG